MSIHANFPVFYTPVIANSGIINRHGGIVQKPVPSDFEGPSSEKEPYVNNIQYYIYPEITPDIEWDALKSLGFVYIAPRFKLYQIYSDNTYVYGITTDGIIVNEITTNLTKCNVTLSSYVGTTVWCNENLLYIGTTTGVYYDVSQNVINSCTFSGTNVYTYTDNVTYIHGYGSDLFVATSSGVEYISDVYHTKTVTPDVTQCCLSENTGYYVNTSSIGGVTYNNINVIYNMNTDWVTPSYIYTTGSGILESNITITDFLVTTKTGSYNKDTIICSTTNGVYVIDDGDKTYKLLKTPDLAGTTNSFESVWCDNSTSKNNGTLYIASKDTLQIVTITDGIVSVVKTITDVANGSDVVDITAKHNVIA